MYIIINKALLKIYMRDMHLMVRLFFLSIASYLMILGLNFIGFAYLLVYLGVVSMALLHWYIIIRVIIVKEYL